MRKISVVAAAVVCGGFASYAAAQSNSDLPDIGTPAGTIANLDDEYQIGRMVIREFREQNEILEDPEVAEYVQSLGLRLSSQAPDSSRIFHYLVARESDINAEALPGAFIVVNYGTILASENESELAGVLAHETAHVTQRHLVRSALASTHQSLETMAAVLGAIALGAVGAGPAAVEGGIMAAEGMGAQMQINFTRDQEYEADRVGMTYLAHAGFDPLGMPNFFEAFYHRYGYGESNIPRMLLDHPVTSERIAEARNRAAQMERPKHVEDSVNFALVQERLRVLTATDEFDLRGYYAGRVNTPHPTLAARYGQALALVQRSHPADAIPIVQPLVSANQGVIMLHTLLAQAQIAAGQVPEGLATFARALALFPRNTPLTVRYAEALIAANQAAKAHALLLDLFNNEPPTPPEVRLTALAASSAGDAGDAYYYMGEYNIENGQFQLATQQLELALASPDLTVVQRKRFQARLKEVRDAILEDRRAHGGRSPNTGNNGGAGGD
ncbi:MAG TPA: M48 family metalloprotease [Steroidobacteraceae bacterium]|nr:M48 family metalloprotease [Steroidobacteraceae bacterium]